MKSFFLPISHICKNVVKDPFIFFHHESHVFRLLDLFQALGGKDFFKSVN